MLCSKLLLAYQNVFCYNKIAVTEIEIREDIMEYSSEKIKDNIDRLKEEKAFRDNGGEELIYDNEIAEELGIKPSTYCKRLHGVSDFSAKEIISLANFFKVSCDEIITGKPPKKNAIYERTPLDKSSISFINRLNYESPDCIELLNIILNNNDKNHLGERLLKTIL